MTLAKNKYKTLNEQGKRQKLSKECEEIIVLNAKVAKLRENKTIDSNATPIATLVDGVVISQCFHADFNL